MPMSPRLLRPRASSALVAVDADAKAYINAVRTADGGQYMEAGVQRAIDAFVIGCKADGIWSAIKASCILMGARTLSGALTPLAGTAPTNNNFVSGDYNRKTGLVGDGTTKYLNSNRAGNADPQNDFHMASYCASTAGLNNSSPIGTGAYGKNGSTFFSFYTAAAALRLQSYIRQAVNQNEVIYNAAGFFGGQRNSQTAAEVVAQNTSNTVSGTPYNSQAPLSGNLFVFAVNDAGTAYGYTSCRLAFYSFGQSLSLTSLRTRLGTLYADIGAAIL